jgi:hypothetical protein
VRCRAHCRSTDRDRHRLEGDALLAALAGLAGDDELHHAAERLAVRALARQHDVVGQRTAIDGEARSADRDRPVARIGRQRGDERGDVFAQALRGLVAGAEVSRQVLRSASALSSFFVVSASSRCRRTRSASARSNESRSSVDAAADRRGGR